MKKILISIFSLVVLAGCSSYYDYYKGGVRYTQDGTDCIYYSGEKGRRFSNEVRGMNSGKKIVYRNTICANLYEKDMAGQAPRVDRHILTPAAIETTPSCGCKSSCGHAALKRRYVIVSSI
ncbi:MAG: lipoprotein [Rickettsiales bacterium]|jgi:hypothetical protein|nr:lipoprotein [Rickettsiales bacterium]